MLDEKVEIQNVRDAWKMFQMKDQEYRRLYFGLI